jgi:hypothetical protein
VTSLGLRISTDDIIAKSLCQPLFLLLLSGLTAINSPSATFRREERIEKSRIGFQNRTYP